MTGTRCVSQTGVVAAGGVSCQYWLGIETLDTFCTNSTRLVQWSALTSRRYIRQHLREFTSSVCGRDLHTWDICDSDTARCLCVKELLLLIRFRVLLRIPLLPYYVFVSCFWYLHVNDLDHSWQSPMLNLRKLTSLEISPCKLPKRLWADSELSIVLTIDSIDVL